ncbi:hypothetical protein HG536_0A05510 [Torulaspora globosa]|uniref:PX domain-containing protein n=1 Tax=Torulaspora globosa TaxID=48254 RepID=A0A7G3ZB50_9SACH|nr:uncharacterized protein HG536_0A05510 [Torulaspora globosa]QLL30736.1 hypothetical protein HG536_0A05510 [Torulaspora globosa]
MNIFADSEEEDNNPFSGTNHLYASGIAAVADGEDDFIPKGIFVEEEEEDVSEVDSGRDKSAVSHKQDDEVHDESFGASSLTANAPFEPYVSLSMSMANGNAGAALPEDNAVISIPEAGDYKDPWGKHAIGYVIKYQGKEIIRRYSEFDTLRQALIRLLPTIVVPPIPSKHPLIKYFLSPLSVENDSRIIEKRKRMLGSFLNNCHAICEIRDHIVFAKFLNPEYSWKNVLNSPPIVILPMNNLLAPPLNPTKPSPLHLLLPAQTALSRLDPKAHNGSSIELETKFAHLEGYLAKYKQALQPLHRILRQHRLHFRNLSALFSELGAYYNAFSLEGNVITSKLSAAQIKPLSNGIEKIGHGFDVNYVSSEILVEKLLTVLEEPASEILQFLEESQRVLLFRKLKKLQYQIIENTLAKREARIKSLKETQHQLQRLEEALLQNARESPTIAKAVKHRESGNLSENADQIESQNAESEQQNLGPTQSSHTQPPKPRKRDKARRSARSSDMEPHLLTEEERQEEIQRLYKEVEKLNDCFALIKKDMDEVNQSSLRSLSALVEYIDRKWTVMLKDFAKAMVCWLRECLNAWQNARQIVSGIEP